MRRHLIRLANQRNYLPKNTIPLMVDLRKKVDGFGSVVKNLRITGLAIEFDLYSPDDSSKKKSIDELSKSFGKFLNERDLQEETANQPAIPSLHQSKEETVKLSVGLFNEQRYWECHETMEQIWRRERSGPEKEVQQGLILAASALVHYQKDENDVCLGMIPRTLSKLSGWKEATYLSLNVERLKENLNNILVSKEIMPFSI